MSRSATRTTFKPLTGEELCERSAITTDEARCDVSARGFWSAGQVAFLDVKVFNPNANRYVNQSLNKTYEINEKEKKNLFFSYQEYWHVHLRKQISGVV